MKPNTAALYLRVSSEGQSLDNQRPQLLQLAQARGLEIVAVFEEKVSAVKQRLAFEAMQLAAHQGKFSHLLVVALDRFGRSMIGNMTAVLELDRIGVQIISVREGWLDTSGPVRPLLISIFSWVAEMERQTVISRPKAGIDRARRAGKVIGRPKVRVDLAEALTLRASGMSIRAVAIKLGVGAATLHRLLAAHEQVAGSAINDPKVVRSEASSARSNLAELLPRDAA
jgi:DNA invertase Pin-like site-specific DNA recombinase